MSLSWKLYFFYYFITLSFALQDVSTWTPCSLGAWINNLQNCTQSCYGESYYDTFYNSTACGDYDSMLNATTKCNRNQSQRRKACHQCVSSKAKCNLKRPSCSRCHLRGVICQYTTSEEPNTPVFEATELSIEENIPSLSTPDISNIFQSQPLQAIFDPNLFDTFFSDLGPCSSVSPSDLVLQSSENMNPEEVIPCGNNNRFSSPEYEPPDRTSFSQLQNYSEVSSAALANHSMELIFRVLRTWPRMLAEEFQIPPIFHFTHFAQYNALPRPLATCMTLVKMWNGQCAGAEEIVRTTILKELDLIVHSVSLDAYIPQAQLTGNRKSPKNSMNLPS
ncbi:hypothetical protein N7540_001750 [Penicillium herquei]|nr:hypothetical protein N7540_001750 [Penicillium herquei]